MQKPDGSKDTTETSTTSDAMSWQKQRENQSSQNDPWYPTTVDQRLQMVKSVRDLTEMLYELGIGDGKEGLFDASWFCKRMLQHGRS